jgi:hypothetical protein
VSIPSVARYLLSVFQRSTSTELRMRGTDSAQARKASSRSG